MRILLTDGGASVGGCGVGDGVGIGVGPGVGDGVGPGVRGVPGVGGGVSHILQSKRASRNS